MVRTSAEQLAARAGQMGRLALQTTGRFHNLMIQPDEPATFCAPLTRQALAQVQAVFTGPLPDGGYRVTAPLPYGERDS